jgi:hypothetical protein
MNTNFVTDDYQNYIISTFCDSRLERNISTSSRKIDLSTDIKSFKNFLIEENIISLENETTNLFAISQDRDLIVCYRDKTWAISISLHGSKSKIDEFVQKLEHKFNHNPCYIRWVYDPQYLESMTMPINNKNMPTEEMYPFLGEETLASYYDRFINSSANILVLIGLPGTGKTTMIRGMLAHARKSATLTYHPKVLEQDAFFVNWLESEDMFLILEDSDTLLLPREDGNEMMSRFLNMGDGLMSFQNKKIIFSTNLPNVADIDDALTRPGRCFDILEFDYLDRSQAKKLCDKFEIELPDGDKLTVSEIFASKKNDAKYRKRTKVGFL